MTKKVAPMVITEEITKQYRPEWFKRDFCSMSEEFKLAMKGLKKKYNRCFGCNWPFQIGIDGEEGEKMHLVNFKAHGNELVCTDCLNEIFGDKAKLECWSIDSLGAKAR